MRYDTTVLYSCNCFEKLQTQQVSKFVVHFMTFNYTLYKTNRCVKRLYTSMNTIYSNHESCDIQCYVYNGLCIKYHTLFIITYTLMYIVQLQVFISTCLYSLVCIVHTSKLFVDINSHYNKTNTFCFTPSFPYI